MWSTGHRKQTPGEAQTNTAPLPMPGFPSHYVPMEHSSISDAVPGNGSQGTSPILQQLSPVPASSQLVTQQAISSTALGPWNGAPPAFSVTGQLVDVQTGKVPTISNGLSTSARHPVIIPSTGKKSVGILRPPKPQGKRIGVHIAVSVMLVLIVGVALVAVLPAGNGLANGFSLFNAPWSINSSKGNNTGLIGLQAATATAVTQDGYEPANNQTYAGVKQVVLPGADGDYFSAGQCTYWADYRYHYMTGYYVPWGGDAYMWYQGAINSGWVASSTPNPNGPSIMVLAPGVQGASWAYGHVAYVEHVNADGSVYTSNWNLGIGGWGVTRYFTFYQGAGVHFVWHP